MKLRYSAWHKINSPFMILIKDLARDTRMIWSLACE